MSFILDALRKSEHARQQQTGPGLAEIPVATTKSRTNVWAAAAVALLVVNLLAVGILLLRRADRQDDAKSQAARSAAAATNAPATTSDAPAAPSATSAVEPVAMTTTANPTLTPETEPPVMADPEDLRPPPAEPGRNPLADEVGDTAGGQDPALAAGAAAVPPGPTAVASRGVPKRGSVVYAPEAVDGSDDSAPAHSPPRSAATASSLPTADEITARGSLPALHLDLHVYAASPQQRFIFVNSQKYREGETLQEGPVVEQITTDGAVLNFRGSRFRLTND